MLFRSVGSHAGDGHIYALRRPSSTYELLCGRDAAWRRPGSRGRAASSPPGASCSSRPQALRPQHFPRDPRRPSALSAWRSRPEGPLRESPESARCRADPLRRFAAGLPVSVRRPTRIERNPTVVVPRRETQVPRRLLRGACCWLPSAPRPCPPQFLTVRAEWERAGPRRGCSPGFISPHRRADGADGPVVVAKVEDFPSAHGGLMRVSPRFGCGGGFRPSTRTIDDGPTCSRPRPATLESLSSYVPQGRGNGGNPRLAAQAGAVRSGKLRTRRASKSNRARSLAA
jgi:hypothetical protein